MAELAAVGLFAVAVAASFFAAWTIGAGPTGATPFPPAVGANAITTLRATLVVGLLGFVGAVFQGAAVTKTVGQGLIRGVALSPLAATIALTIAVIDIAAGVSKGTRSRRRSPSGGASSASGWRWAARRRGTSTPRAVCTGC